MKCRPAAASVVVALALAVCTSVLAVAPAQAAKPKYPTKVSVSKNYRVVKTYESGELKRCFAVTATGTISAKGRRYKGVQYAWSAIRLTNPKVRVTSRSCSTGKAKRLVKLRLKQAWYQSQCKSGVKVSAGFPWAVGATATVECGSYKAGSRTTTYGKAASFEQANSGTPITFGKVRWRAKLCVAANLTAVAYPKANKSDSFTLRTGQVCVTPQD